MIIIHLKSGYGRMGDGTSKLFSGYEESVGSHEILYPPPQPETQLVEE